MKTEGSKCTLCVNLWSHKRQMTHRKRLGDNLCSPTAVWMHPPPNLFPWAICLSYDPGMSISFTFILIVKLYKYLKSKSVTHILILYTSIIISLFWTKHLNYSFKFYKFACIAHLYTATITASSFILNEMHQFFV